MIQRALKLRLVCSAHLILSYVLILIQAIDEWVFGEERELLLTPDQWDMLSKLRDLLKVLLQVNILLRFSWFW